MITSTEDRLRKQILVLLDFGVTQRELANRLDVHESWFSRWLKQEEGKRSPDVNEMDRFYLYVEKFYGALANTRKADGDEQPQPRANVVPHRKGGGPRRKAG
jgi:hypothetical protein